MSTRRCPSRSWRSWCLGRSSTARPPPVSTALLLGVFSLPTIRLRRTQVSCQQDRTGTAPNQPRCPAPSTFPSPARSCPLGTCQLEATCSPGRALPAVTRPMDDCAETFLPSPSWTLGPGGCLPESPTPGLWLKPDFTSEVSLCQTRPYTEWLKGGEGAFGHLLLQGPVSCVDCAAGPVPLVSSLVIR